MPISPTGTVKTRKRSKQAGFTLVEVLMSMLIIGLMTGIVVLNLPEGDDPWEDQARELASKFQIASQSAMISNQSIGIKISKQGYEIVRFVAGDWVEIEGSEFSGDIPISIELVQNGAKIDLKAAAKTEVPVIRYDATGLATPFELTIDGYGRSMQFVGGPDGTVELVLDGAS
ncbi:MAG: prepilin-type N-terminal cleavage/methylation domain-containing protein [Hyphomonadaceae bacterium]|nr:prepilin-type N-terminal cleavage/methylation domain-containing protein [Hyphomonadaceae bacterium]